MAFAAADAVLAQLHQGQAQLQQGQAQLQQSVAQLQQSVAQLQQGQAQLQQSVAQLLQGQAQMQQGLAAAGIATTIAQRQAAARRANAVSTDAPFVVLPCADGSSPPHWPAGLCSAALRTLNAAATSALLLDYALPLVGTLDAKRVRIADFIGTRY